MAFLPRTLNRTVNLTASAATTPAINFEDSRGVILQTPSDLNNNTTATVYASATEDGTYTIIEDATGSDVAVTLTASRAHEVSSAVFAAKWIKFVTDSGALNSCVVMLKS